GAFKNEQQEAPTLPLTGGLGTDAFLLAGGGLLALAGFGGWIHKRRSSRAQVI
ncbi:LPXTG cell wall anchor domain-containing protein, partial [Actinomyces polynesiensis]|uniref:LPXTG cell wall anchor domain-containing protein n=1 Tax=Actinomyces polynesiensis TaxID=1325934 RepID=UPI0011CCC9A4